MPKLALGLVVAILLFGVLAPAYGARNSLIALAIVAAVLAVRGLMHANRKAK